MKLKKHRIVAIDLTPVIAGIGGIWLRSFWAGLLIAGAFSHFGRNPIFETEVI